MKLITHEHWFAPTVKTQSGGVILTTCMLVIKKAA